MLMLYFLWLCGIKREEIEQERRRRVYWMLWLSKWKNMFREVLIRLKGMYVHMCALRNLSYVDRIQPHLNNRNWSNFNAHTNCTIVQRQWFIINAFIYEWFLELTKLWKDELLTFVCVPLCTNFVYGRIQ